jgi:hypothetical protein
LSDQSVPGGVSAIVALRLVEGWIRRITERLKVTVVNGIFISDKRCCFTGPSYRAAGYYPVAPVSLTRSACVHALLIGLTGLLFGDSISKEDDLNGHTDCGKWRPLAAVSVG